MTLVIDLPPEKEATLKAQAQAAGLSVEEYALKTLSSALASEPTSPSAQDSADDRPIWEAIVENMADIPAEDMEKAPRDGAAQVDHYLYGHSKQEGFQVLL